MHLLKAIKPDGPDVLWPARPGIGWKVRAVSDRRWSLTGGTSSK